MNAKEIEGTDSEKNAIQIGQNECLFHQIQRYHYELKKKQTNIITDNQIQRYHSDVTSDWLPKLNKKIRKNDDV